MRRIQDIYDKYQILPILREHQLRVAAVAKMLCLNLKKPVKTEQVVLACLFHDMGNIIKFDLKSFPEFYEPLGVAYWQKVKEDFIIKYGHDEHEANIAISKENRLLP